ncbi:MAG TPA: hypothetical protein VKU01_15095 [Bryobacteraceae bacterium]|nr:hypothetical protein [Bryobacteraceae bacterium]
MRSAFHSFVLTFLAAGFGLHGQQPGDLTGNWYLNVDKSDWGAAKRPQSVVLHINHKEPALRYTGTVAYPNEDTRDFAFDGAIDGKSYPMTRSYGVGSAVLRRIDTGAFESVFRTDDGSYIETVRTALSRGGQVLTRKVRLQTPQGTNSWTEIYERR